MKENLDAPSSVSHSVLIVICNLFIFSGFTRIVCIIGMVHLVPPTGANSRHFDSLCVPYLL